MDTSWYRLSETIWPKRLRSSEGCRPPRGLHVWTIQSVSAQLRHSRGSSYHDESYARLLIMRKVFLELLVL